METIRCPYCDSKVLVSDVETDDGTCPECGAPLMGSHLFDEDPGGSDDIDADDEDVLGFDDSDTEDDLDDDEDDDH